MYSNSQNRAAAHPATGWRAEPISPLSPQQSPFWPVNVDSRRTMEPMTLAIDALPQLIDLGGSWRDGFASLGPAFFTELQPTPLPDPVPGRPERAAGAGLGLDPRVLASPRRRAGVHRHPCRWPGARPLATVYSGHQFGVWAGQLGDGRAILLGEIDTPPGRRSCSSRARPHALLAHGRRPRRAALEHPRIPGLRGDARPGHPDHARAERHRLAAPVRREEIETAAVVTARGAELHPLRPLRAFRRARPAATSCGSWPTSSSTASTRSAAPPTVRRQRLRGLAASR